MSTDGLFPFRRLKEPCILYPVTPRRFLMSSDGLFLGSSSAMNCVGAVRAARLLGPGHTVVTILCDSGFRHVSKFHNPEYLAAHGLTPKACGLEFLDDDVH